MSRRMSLRVVARLAAAMAAGGFAIAGLSFFVVLPDPVGFWFLGLALTVVAAGAILCRPYLTIAGRGWTLGSAAGDAGRLIPALAVAGFLAMWVIGLSSSLTGPSGNPDRTPTGGYALNYKGTVTEVSRSQWLAARRSQTRAVVSIPTAFLCGIWWWCVASSRARNDDPTPEA